MSCDLSVCSSPSQPLKRDLVARSVAKGKRIAQIAVKPTPHNGKDEDFQQFLACSTPTDSPVACAAGRALMHRI